MNKTTRNKKGYLGRFIDGLLKEDTIPETPKNPQEFAPVQTPQDVSLDQIVDRYLIRYEKESIPTVDNYEKDLVEEASYSSVLEYVMNEAEGDEDPPADAEDASGGELDLGGGEDAGAAAGGNTEASGGGELPDAGLDLGDAAGDADGGGDEGSEDNKAVMSTPQINLNNFARSIARLVNNYEVLVNPKNTILSRAKAYVASNYDERTAQELMDVLDKNYSLRTTNQQEKQELDVKTPMTAGALGDPGG
jgi:hypothetical protein